MAGGSGLRRGGAVRPEPGSRISAAFGGVPVGDPYAIADLRRQQAGFAKVRREIDRQNSWLAVPALAPVAAVLALEGVGLTAADVVSSLLDGSAHDFKEREPKPKLRGDNWHTRNGRREHAAFEAKVRQKEGWEAEKTMTTQRGRIRVDALTPERSDGKRRILDLKPDTPTGRKAAARVEKRYLEATGHKTRAVFYKPTR